MFGPFWAKFDGRVYFAVCQEGRFRERKTFVSSYEKRAQRLVGHRAARRAIRLRREAPPSVCRIDRAWLDGGTRLRRVEREEGTAPNSHRQ